ncbi:MAG: NADH-quinone oxidoreductase subunit J [Elusimicrobia bacterium]|nr:NADH-quinone oxidoreductase subunit J [Elusimicrobiota bacterium]
MAFAYLAAASVTSALLAVTRRNPIHSVLWVLALFLHVAGIFLLAGAQFLAATQIIIYAGAILVFYLIILMLLDLKVEGNEPRYGAHWIFGVAAGLGFVVLAATALRSLKGLAFDGPLPEGVLWQPTVADLGTALFGDFAVHFEIASLILLAAIVGAIVLGKRRAQPANGKIAQSSGPAARQTRALSGTNV